MDKRHFLCFIAVFCFTCHTGKFKISSCIYKDYFTKKIEEKQFSQLFSTYGVRTIGDGQVVSRVTRKTQDDGLEKQICCRDSTLLNKTIPDPNNIEKIYSDCVKKYEKLKFEDSQTLETRAETDRKIVECVMQCVFDDIKVVDDQENLMKDENTKLWINVIGIVDKKLADKFIEKCWKHLEGYTGAEVDGHICNPAVSYFLQCFEDIFDMVCMEEFQIKNESCDAHRAKLQMKYQ